MEIHWFFSAPDESAPVRRGDALGLQPLANMFADIIAPGLSNRTVDARWLTILCWCLKQSDSVFRRLVAGYNYGDEWLQTREGARLRYECLQPLELMFVYWGIKIDKKNDEKNGVQGSDEKVRRQLPGQRTISGLVEPGIRIDQAVPEFGMSEYQLQRYRYAGIYGAYRKALRDFYGLTVPLPGNRRGDGWNLGEIGSKLAEEMDGRLGEVNRFRTIDSLVRKLIGRFECPPEMVLPQDRMRLEPLPWREKKLLEGAIFGKDRYGKRRRASAEEISCATDDLVRAFARGELSKEVPALRYLEFFDDLTTSAFEVLMLIAKAGENAGSTLSLLAPHAGRDCRKLMDATGRWRKARKAWGNDGVSFNMESELVKADDLAIRIAEAGRDVVSVMRALVDYHQERGGGLRWVGVRDESGGHSGLIRLITVFSGQSAPRYTYRFFQLERLAVQCGVVTPSGKLQDWDDNEPGDDGVE